MRAGKEGDKNDEEKYDIMEKREGFFLTNWILKVR
jgi:hypothetical protein